MEKSEKTGIFDSIWNFLASVKLAIVILIVLALTSIVGTIVEQRAEQAKNVELLAKFFGDEAAPTVYNIFVKLGFMDMYRSWWFITILILFSINLIVCSLDRFPKTLRLVRMPMKPLRENVIKTLPVRREIQVKSDLKAAREAFSGALTSSKYHVSEETGEDSALLYSQKGAYTRFGVYVVHLSILMIFIGAIIGARFGFGGFLNIPEGGTSSVIYTVEGGEPIPLDFAVRCNWYDTEYYYGTDAPQDFKSELVIIDGGKEVMKKVIEVNSPLTYKGVTFYQASYGMVPNATGEFFIRVVPNGGQGKELRLRPNESFEIPGTDIKGTVVNFSPALARDPATGALKTYSEQMTNPAVAIEIAEPGRGKYTGWFLKRYPDTWTLPGSGHRIEFIDYWGVEYAGLQVSKDPGVGLIYFACIVMTFGLYVCFFMSNKKLWISLVPVTPGKKGHVRICAGGSATKNRLAFEREIEDLLAKVSVSLEGGHTKKK